VFGPDGVTVHIRDPRHPLRILCHVELRNEALASSGGAFDPFESSASSGAAVIDPSTRGPVSAVGGATVRAPSCMAADALTKLVMVAGESAATLLERYRASAMLVPREGDPFVTRSWWAGARVAS
jgi:FAD:protein FMN transferase